MASKGSLAHLHGWDVSAHIKKLKGIKEPDTITSTKLRKYIATNSQNVALMEVDTDWLAHNLGMTLESIASFIGLHKSTTE